jgi:hypothetical protein
LDRLVAVAAGARERSVRLRHLRAVRARLLPVAFVVVLEYRSPPDAGSGVFGEAQVATTGRDGWWAVSSPRARLCACPQGRDRPP